MPFGNSSLNPFPKVQAVNTMRDSYYYEELTGVKYDNLENLGYPNPLPSASGRALRLAGDEILFVGKQTCHYNNSEGRYSESYIELFQVITSTVTLKTSMWTITSTMALRLATNRRSPFGWVVLCVLERPGRFAWQYLIWRPWIR